MKTLEDKAQEYSVMSGALDAGYSTETEEAYRQGAREAQHWFSVSEELPDTSVIRELNKPPVQDSATASVLLLSIRKPAASF